ncbi:MAG: hypothetical protein Ct9H300mP31_11910 [Acidimicrobiaceae bacterium]|nr:MAG: hypothetical protein Ct9H300mP31_11910 [Acidimicrobiaceae bacterium]
MTDLVRIRQQARRGPLPGPRSVRGAVGSVPAMSPPESRFLRPFDVRGRVPEGLDEPLAEAIGRAFCPAGPAERARHRPGGSGTRYATKGVPLAAAFTRGLVAEGAPA